ncbi:aldehyde dehydrogenase family protein [Ensifer sp. YR511]|uniref:aldehyde dehydrogenase family protein n=1 Tax=Ensifer sp. YR511 TaxID=1855294 RepID=UPI000881188D|nr:aldehyde dehydrogenase family protein [Ensifer sp. YR511]SDN34772.1 aldehyde dehydrogenase (NAD+) [Ensifer sp. YR511]
MTRDLQFFIGGKWCDPIHSRAFNVIDPSSEETFRTISLGSNEDVELAVAAARKALPSYSATSIANRVDLLKSIAAIYERRKEHLAYAVHREMGAPMGLARSAQVALGAAHLAKMIEILPKYAFSQRRRSYHLHREPIGVCALITPWNWPLNQIAAKVAPALAAGCTVILKPSEYAPISAIVFAEILEEAGIPAGVFNLINGDGPGVGEALARHPDVDMVSFTGSTQAGVRVAQLAAETVKRVSQELGGKSPNIILEDADIELAVMKGVVSCFGNSGQSCNAPTRMFVPAARREEAYKIAAKTAEAFSSGSGTPALGPVVNKRQYDRIQGLIQAGIDEGATLLAGGKGKPHGVSRGFFVRPTVFADVGHDTRLSREEIFGPVLSIITYENEEDAIRMANDTVYGLAAYIQSSDEKRARKLASELKAGNVYINYPAWSPDMPFGGYKQSGNGREFAEFGLEDFLEVKGVIASTALSERRA